MSNSIFHVRPLDSGKGWAIDEYDGRGAWQYSVPIEEWARHRGYRGRVETIPLGATVLPDADVSTRQGVAYLGRVFFAEKGIDSLIQAAERLPDIPFYFATARGTELENTIKLKRRLVSVPNARLTHCGIGGRAALLQKVRVVAVLGKTDWQWLPGTEIRGAHGVAMAGQGTPVEKWNGDGLFYFDGLENLVSSIRRFHEDDAAFEAEATRQHRRFLERGMSASAVGKKLWDWIQAGVHA